MQDWHVAQQTVEDLTRERDALKKRNDDNIAEISRLRGVVAAKGRSLRSVE
jgi:hypothetical protein